jgi:hypothetical protein
MDGKPPEATAVETPRVGDLERSLGVETAAGRAKCHPQVAEAAGDEEARREPTCPGIEVVVGGADGETTTYRATYLPN